VPVLPAVVATTAQQAGQAARDLGGTTVVKAQVKTGGRGKAGGVIVAPDPVAAERAAEKILGMDIKGHVVKKVMVAAGADIAREFYFSILLDRAERRYLAMCSVQGGMDIERLAEEHPDALARVPVDPLTGITHEVAEAIVAQAGFDTSTGDAVVPVLQRLWDVYVKEDATLVEVNPLVQTSAGDILALDGKVTLDTNASFRHEDHHSLQEESERDPREAKAHAWGLNYVKLDGNVGIIGNGAGLVMSTLDVVAYAGQDHGGARPANFLDIGGGASAEVMARSLEVVLSDNDVRSVFVNVFGGITSCVEVAEGIVEALKALGDSAHKPIVVRLDGNAVERGREILAAAAHPLVTIVEAMDDAAAEAARLANR